MKKLVIQLSELGDIYMSWPTLRSMKRKDPDHEIHFLVRKCFEKEAQSLGSLVTVKGLPGGSELNYEHLDINSLTVGRDNFGAAEKEVIDGLILENYDEIINLSFSGSASGLAALVSKGQKPIRGYSRHEDGSLSIKDDSSAYFYAQVGSGSNRIHTVDLFANISGVTLDGMDWLWPKDIDRSPSPRAPSDNYICVNIGASKSGRSLSDFKWRQIITQLEKAMDCDIVLLSLDPEVELRPGLRPVSQKKKIHSVIDSKAAEDVFRLLRGSRLLIGCDNVIQHMAGFSKTPCLHLCVGDQSFWETGPLSQGSCVLHVEDENDLASDRVVKETGLICEGKSPRSLVYICEKAKDHSRYVFIKTIARRLYLEFSAGPLYGNSLPRGGLF